MSYFVTYRRREDVQSFRDVGTVFCKMVLDDEVPGTLKTPDGAPAALDAAASCRDEADLLWSHCGTITLQAQSTALVLTHPHLSLGGPPDGMQPHGVADFSATGPRALSALSEMVIFPSHFGGADETLVGGKARRSWSGQAKHGAWIVARRGRLLIGVRPLVYSRELGETPITLEKINNYEIIRSTFYRGDARAFSRGELRHVFGGFVAEHASVDEFPSLAAFAAALAEAKFTDYFWTTRRTRYRRPQSTARAALDLEVSWSPGTHAPRYATINGQPVATPIVQIDGLKPKAMPLAQEGFQPVPAFFPWKDFKVAWGDWPYAIGDREA